MRRGLSGILLVDKPAGLTSHDVVERVRRATGERRVGHAGTLDPMATGLLVVLVGPATRLAPYLTAAEKTYVARIAFGAETDTDDAEGTVTRTADVPGAILDAAAAQRELDALLGESQQVPPAYSAIKVDGKVAHRVARSGGEVELAPRAITVLRAELLGLDADSAAWDVDFLVSKGTYVRALARDLGRAVDSAAHLRALRRTSSGALALADAHPLQAIETAAASGELAALFADPVAALGLPTVEADAHAVMCGRTLEAPEGDAPLVAVLADDTLVAVYRRDGDRLVADAVFPIAEGDLA